MTAAVAEFSLRPIRTPAVGAGDLQYLAAVLAELGGIPIYVLAVRAFDHKSLRSRSGLHIRYFWVRKK